MLIPGGFDADGSPIVKIKVSGDLGEKEYTAVIDTGCTGFVALPFAEMIPLGLTIRGAVSVQLGNGAMVDNMIAEGIVTLSSQAEIGTIILDETSNDILVGLDFLRRFKLGLILTDTVVVLYDSQETIEAIAEFMASAPAGSPTPEADLPTPEEAQ
jgi:predicted aspartyl protease